MMTKLSAVGATLLLCLVCSPGARAWCDEDCAYEAHEAAYERAAEREYARESAAEEGYVMDDRRNGRSSRGSKRAARAMSEGGSEDSSRAKRVAEPQSEPQQPAPSTEKTRGPTRVAKENSSIATGSTRIAEDDGAVRETPRREVGCKTFFPSVGMTLSVPCD